MWEHMVLPIVVVFALYYAGRRVKACGEFYATVLLVARRLLVMLHEALKGFQGTPQQQGTPSAPPGRAVIAKLMGLAIGVVLLAGEVVGSIAAGAALFGTEMAIPLHGVAALSAAILLIALGVAFGVCALEAMEWLPDDVRLFSVPQSARKVFRWSAIICLFGSVVAMSLFYALRVWYLQDPTDIATQVLQKATMCVGGPLVVLAGAVALWMIVVGLQALVQLVLGTVGLLAGALVDVIDLLVRQFGAGLEAVPGRTERTERSLPNTHKGDSAMDDLRNVGVYGLEDFGSDMLAKLEQLLRQARANVVGSSGSVNSYRPVTRAVRLGEDVSPSLMQRDHILGVGKGEEGRRAVFGRLAHLVVQDNGRRPRAGAALFFFIPPEALSSAEGMLRHIQRHLAGRALAVVTQVDDENDCSPKIQEGLTAMRTLWQEKIIATTFVFSARSGLVEADEHHAGEAKQRNFMAATIANLMLADSQGCGPTCVKCLEILSAWSPFTSCGFASTGLSVSGTIRVPWIRQFLGGEQGIELLELNNIFRVGEAAADAALTNPDNRAIRAEIGKGPALLIGALPLLKQYEPQLSTVRDELSRYVTRKHNDGKLPKVEGIVMVRANGEPLELATRRLDRCYMQVSALFSLPANFFEHQQKVDDAAHAQTPPLTGQEWVTPVTAEEHLGSQEPSRNGATKKQRV